MRYNFTQTLKRKTSAQIIATDLLIAGIKSSEPVVRNFGFKINAQSLNNLRRGNGENLSIDLSDFRSRFNHSLVCRL